MSAFNEEDRKWLYDTMQSKGVDTGSYDDFKNSLNNDEDRQWYFDKSQELGLDVGNRQDFDDMMWERPQEPKPTEDHPYAGMTVNTPDGMTYTAAGLDSLDKGAAPVLTGESAIISPEDAAPGSDLWRQRTVAVPGENPNNGRTYGQVYDQVIQDFGKNINHPDIDPYAEARAQIVQAGITDDLKPEQADALALNIREGYANQFAGANAKAMVSQLPDQVPNIDQLMDGMWYNRDLQAKLDKEAQRLGLSHENYVNFFMKPQLAKALSDRYGYDVNSAKSIAARLLSGEQHTMERVRQGEANDMVGRYAEPKIQHYFDRVLNAAGQQLNNEAQNLQITPTGNAGQMMGAALNYYHNTDPIKVWEKMKPEIQQMAKDIIDQEFILEADKRADEEGVTIDQWIESRVEPYLLSQIQSKFEQMALEREMPKNTMDYLMANICKSLVGQLGNAILASKARRRMQDEALARTEIGQGQYKPGFGARVAGGVAAMLPDMMYGGPFGLAAKTATAPVQGMSQYLIANGMRPLLARMLQSSAQGALSLGAFEGVKGAAEGLQKDRYDSYLDEDQRSAAEILQDIVKGSFENAIQSSVMGATMIGGPLGQKISNGRGALANALGWGTQVGVDAAAATALNIPKLISGEVTMEDLGNEFAQNLGTFAALGLNHKAKEFASLADGGRAWNGVEFTKKDIETLEGRYLQPLRKFITEVEKTQNRRGLIEQSSLGIEASQEQRDAIDSAGADMYRDLMHSYAVPRELKVKVAQALGMPIPEYALKPEVAELEKQATAKSIDLGWIDAMNYEYNKPGGVVDKVRNGESLSNSELTMRLLFQDNEAFNQALLKQQNGEQLTNQEQELIATNQNRINQIFREYAKEESGRLAHLFEKEHGLQSGTLARMMKDAVEGKAVDNNLLNEYEKMLRDYNQQLDDAVAQRDTQEAVEEQPAVETPEEPVTKTPVEEAPKVNRVEDEAPAVEEGQPIVNSLTNSIMEVETIDGRKAYIVDGMPIDGSLIKLVDEKGQPITVQDENGYSYDRFPLSMIKADEKGQPIINERSPEEAQKNEAPKTEEPRNEEVVNADNAPEETPASRIKTAEDGTELWEEATAEDAAAEMRDRAGDDAVTIVDEQIADIESQLKELTKPAKGKKHMTMSERLGMKQAIKDGQKSLEFWNQVKAELEKPAETVEEPQPAAEPKVEDQKPATPPAQPAGPTAEQKIAQGTVKNNIGKRFGFQNQDGTRSEVTIDAFKGDDLVTVTRQDYDKNGQPKGEPYKQDLKLTDVGNSIVSGLMKPALTTDEKLRKVFKVTVGDIPLADVLTEEEQRQLLDLIAKKDDEAVGNLTGDLIDAHHEDLILRGRDIRNSKVDQIMNSNASREQKLRKVRDLYKGYQDAEVMLEDETLTPGTLEEYVADLHSRVPKKGEGPIAYFSYEKDGTPITGMQDETGYGKKNSGDSDAFKPWLAPQGKGVSLMKYAEQIHSQLPEPIQEQYDVNDVRNAILSVFGGAERPSDITTMVIKRGILQAENAARRQEEMWIDGGPSMHKVSADDNSFTGRLTRAKEQTNTEPTEGQKEAGNYKKGHVSFGGYDFVVENPEGSMRRGEADGKKWEQKMNNTYGYILGRYGKDGDHLDMFINDQADLDNWNGKVYVVDQVNPKTGEFDEHKVMYGFDSEAEARDAYLSNYEKGWKGLGKITGVDKDTFDEWLDSSKRKRVPFAEHNIITSALKSEEKAEKQAATASEIDKALMNELVTETVAAGVPMVKNVAEGQAVLDAYNKLNGEASDADYSPKPQKVTDQQELDELNKGKTVKRYRAMQLIDGKLYPPMSAKVDGEMREPTEIGVWEKAEERPDLVKNGKFVLNKGQKGQGNVPAAYNPYFHTSTSGLNDQFTSAYKRPELVVVEVEIPESELTSGYKAEGAKDAVGNVDWHSGVVNGQLPADRQRQVTLSRYSKVNRIVPDSEVADMIAKQLEGTNIEVPYNVVTPAQRAELEKRGVKISDKPAGTVTEDINGNPIKQQKAYHGSGADFDAFDHSHMGEGEGYQTFGYGTYVTEVPNIAKGYAEKGAMKKYNLLNPGYSGKEVLYKGKKIDLNQSNLDPLRLAYDTLNSEGTVKKAVAFVERLMGYAEEQEMKDTWQEVLNILKNSKKSDFKVRNADLSGQRYVYDVEIPDDNGENYLDYELKPTDKQLHNIVTQLYKLGMEDVVKENRIATMIRNANSIGNIIDVLHQYIGGKAAAKLLHDAGYVGTKYPTNYMAGGNREGTKNYVIYDENDAKIIDTTKFFKTPDGHAYGFTYQGKIYIDPRIATAETPIHEYGHLWAEMKRQTSPDEWNHIKDVLLRDELVKPFIDKVKREYPELEGKDDAFAEEVLTQFSGKHGAEKLRKMAEEIKHELGDDAMAETIAQAAIRKVKSILNKFWKGVADMMGWPYTNAEDVADTILRDMLNGVNPVEQMKETAKDMKQQQEIERTLMGVHNLSEDKLRKVIKAGGLANPSLAVVDTNQGIHTSYGDISLIPKASLIDKRTGRNAGTFAGDAWTPTYPHVERMLTKQGEKRAAEIAKEVAGDDEEMARHIRSRINDYYEGAGDRMHFLFLKQKGLDPQIRPERIAHSQDEYDAITKIFGEPTSNMPNRESITKEQNDALVDLMVSVYEKKLRDGIDPEKPLTEKMQNYLDSRVEEYRKNLLDDDGYIWFAKGDNFIHDNWRDEKRRQNPQPDWYGTDNDASYQVAKEGLAEEYEKWKESLLTDDEVEEKLFAGYTPSGNRRYLPNTVENASRLMNKNADQNAYDQGGFGPTRAMLLQNFASLADIRRHKDLIQKDEKVEERTKELSDELFDIINQISDMQKISDNRFSNIDYAEARLQEAMGKKNPIRHLNKEYGYNIPEDGELASQLMNFMEDVKNLPAKYFETKFKRPVTLDEFEIAVVPEGTSEDVVKALKDAGLDVRTFDNTGGEEVKKENRRKAVMDAVTGRDDILFHKKKKEYPIVEGEGFGKKEFDSFRNNYMGKSVDKAVGNKLLHTLKNNAEDLPEVVEFTDENYDRLFGNGIDTPIGHVKMSDNQKDKMDDKSRQNQMALAKRTLEDPDMIISKPSKAKEGQVTERPFSYIFVKTFKDKDGRLATYFFSVSVKRDGLEVSMSNYIPEEKNVLRDLKEGTLAYIRDVTLPSESSTSTQGDQYTIPAGDNSSEGKDNKNINNIQENSGKSSDETPKFQKTPVFVSNALKAAEDIKQEKATPEQWLAMLQKNGGLKTGEDKWLGLSDWLKQQKGSVTKQDVLDYIRKNQIEVEEVTYQEYFDVDNLPKMQEFRKEYKQLYDKYDKERNAINDEMERFNQEMYEKYGQGWANDLKKLSDEDRKRYGEITKRYDFLNDNDIEELAFADMVESYGDDFSMAFEVNYGNGKLEPQMDMYGDDISDAAKHFLEFDVQPINSTRLGYTTNGLENKREIALTVPTIEPWNEGDQIHFGDAGNGRSVAWVRFGDAYYNKNGEPTEVDSQWDAFMSKMAKKYGKDRHDTLGLLTEMTDEERETMNKLDKQITEKEKRNMGRVLVIDEIQSKRHQEGRDKGYVDDEKVKAYNDWIDNKAKEFGVERYQVEPRLTDEEYREMKRLQEAADGIPDAPFEKNWHELAMKRMLRYAAENGYDKIAWTTGEQQADRYDIGDKIKDISVSVATDPMTGKPLEGKYEIFPHNHNNSTIMVDGASGVMDKDQVLRVYGKDLGQRMIDAADKAGVDGDVLSGDDLRIGAEGMQGFYDEILVRFMNKYGKKWNVKVDKTELPAIGETMWSIDVTPEMKESVLQGQPMFQRVSQPEPENNKYQEEWEAAMKDWKERNNIPEDAEAPGEKPEKRADEDMMSYLIRLAQYNRDKGVWYTAPKLEDYQLAGKDQAYADTAHENEKRYPDSEHAKRWRIATDLASIRHAMSRQKIYDKATIKAVTDFANEFMKMGFGDHLTRGEIERMLSSVKNATGNKNIKKQLDNIMNVLMNSHLRNLEAQVWKLASIRELKQTAQGVEKQGRLELKGQRMIQAFREATQTKMTAEEIRNRMEEVAERMTRNDEETPMWEQEYEGLNIALQYAENIEESRKEWAEIDREYKDAVKDYKASGRTYQAQQELLESLEQAKMENVAERIANYGSIIGRLEGNIAESIQGAKEFVEREKQRVKKIHDMANFDLAGKDMGGFHQSDWKKRLSNGTAARFFLGPLGTFEQMLKQFGARNANGEGYLYDYFMRNWMDATDNAYIGERNAKEELDEKAREVFGDKVKRWSDLYELERKLPTMDITVTDQGEQKTFTLTQGNLMYIYMADKMNDGRMKLRKMGITEEDVEQIKDFLDPRLVQLADWLQGEYLPKKRPEYNKVHERMFGAPMAAIENYFPLKILGDARVKEEDVNVPDSETLPSTITGNIIKRRKNALPLDILNTDALSLAIEHVEDMERWAAQAEWNKDVNTLLSYTTFRNKVKNMNTIYGSGDQLWNAFKDAAKMAAGTYSPKVSNGSTDKAISNIAKGVTAAKISFRAYTALKQILSAPAFLHDVDLKDFVWAGANPLGSFKWAMENMPVFEKRWKSRQMGDTRLMDDPTDWKLWKSNIVQLASRWGMSPNALVDGVTCAVGARAIYETRLKKYKEMGMEEDAAKKRALQDAEIGYNLTQQSSEGAFVSAIQKDRTVAANMLSVFRNSSMAYTRQWVDAARNLKHRMQPGYKEDSIKFMTRQFQDQMGLDEAQAQEAAEAAYNRAGRHDIARLLNMMFGVTIAWNLGASLPYLLIGDDWETKKEMMTDALLKGLAAGPTEGLAAGNIYSELVGRALSEETRKAYEKEGLSAAIDKGLSQAADYEINPLPLFADIQGMIKKLGYDKWAAAQDVFNIVAQSTVGVNPQTFTDMYNAIMDYAAPGWDGTKYTYDAENMSRAKELALFFMRVMNAPTSSWRNKYIDELGMNAEDAKKLPYDEMAKRYAHYKHWKDAPIMGWMRGEEGRQEKMEKIQKQFDKAVQERLSRLSEDQMEKVYDATDNEAMRKQISKQEAKRKDSQDTMGTTTSKDEDTKLAVDYYAKHRTWQDLTEDLELESLKRQLPKDSDKRKDIEEDQTAIKDARNSLTDDEATNKKIWEDIRSTRKKALDYARQK